MEAKPGNVIAARALKAAKLLAVPANFFVQPGRGVASTEGHERHERPWPGHLAKKQIQPPSKEQQKGLQETWYALA